MKRLKTIFLGTPDFSVPCLDILKNHPSIDLKYVVSMPDRKAGRGYQLKSPEVIEFAKENKIPFFQTANINTEEDFLTKIKNENIDVIIVLAFAQFLSSEILTLPKLGCFNIHTSLLPKYRGAAPIQYAILNGDTETGVSIQKMVKKMDAGQITWSHSVNISPDETGGQLYTKLKFQAALSLNDFINDLVNNKIKYEEQNEDEVSFAPTLKREDGALDFKSKSFSQIKNQVRALYPWPGTYTYLDGKRLKVIAVEQSPVKLAPGESNIIKNQLIIGCQDSSLRVSQLQLEGKKQCSDIDLFNGYKGLGIINKDI
jgi:methionyl-tRNA formyltransferase